MAVGQCRLLRFAEAAGADFLQTICAADFDAWSMSSSRFGGYDGKRMA